MADLPDDLRESLASALDAAPTALLSASVRRLMEEYRSGRPAAAPIIGSDTDAAAYAAYRMPATFAAVRAALRQVRHAVADLRPSSQLDVAGGTGAATWAATEIFPELTAVTVLDQVDAALRLGRRLCVRATHPALRTATWREWRLEPGADLPAAELVTISYLLGELPPAARESLVVQAAATRGVVVVVEAGTPAGYERVLAARSTFIAQGYTILAPCPHQNACPLAQARDWCHFAGRVNRSALHRRLKDAHLDYEDEKFSYVAAAPGRPPHRVAGRVLRHPEFRKGLVSLQVCAADDGFRPVLVSKRQGDLYRLARDTGWGDAWPPPG
jgi:ribosomal protein RSM22 (predicted rRNA methylase)